VLIRKLILQTETPSRAVAFYRDVLGLEVETQGASQLIHAGSTVIEFHEAKPGERPVYHIAFNVPPNRFLGSVRWLRSRVPLVESEGQTLFEFSSWHAHAAYFFDKVGNILEFIARHEMQEENSSAAFGPEGILNVSEIGVPVADVIAAAEFLHSEFVIPPYRGLDSSFTTMGDAHGLAILVPKEREWYPSTGVISGDFAAEIIFEGKKDKSAMIPGSKCKITSKLHA